MKNNILDVALKDPKFKYAYDFGINNGLINNLMKDYLNIQDIIHKD